MDIKGFGYMVDDFVDKNNFQPMRDALVCCHALKSGLPAACGARMGVVAGHGTVEQEDIMGDYMSLGVAFQNMDTM